MTHRELTLEDIDYRVFFDTKDPLFGMIVRKFPEMKITARGSKIKYSAKDTAQLDLFEKRMRQVIDYVAKYGHLSSEVVDQIFNAKSLDNLKSINSSNKNAPQGDDVIIFGNNGLVVRPRSVNQKRMVQSVEQNDMIFAVGPAGTGKTYTAIAMAVRALKNREVKRIILTRPAVEAGEKLGFLPGDMKEKLDPYLQPLYDALHDMINIKKLGEYVETSVVQIVPLAYMRGRTLDNAFVILDEAQNCTISQLKMFLTRMGRNAKFIVTGDMTQIDLPNRRDSGLEKIVEMVEPIEGIDVIRMEGVDIVRHKLVKQIVDAFENSK